MSRTQTEEERSKERLETATKAAFSVLSSLRETLRNVHAMILDAEKAASELHEQATGFECLTSEDQSVCDIPGTPFQCVVAGGHYVAVIHRGVDVGEFVARYVHDLAETVAREEAEFEASREAERKTEIKRDLATA